MSTLLADKPPITTEDRSSLPGLLGELTGQLVTLGQQEIQLAKSELKQSAKKTATDSIGIVTGGVIIHAALLAFVAAAAAGLALVMPMWASLLSVGAVLAIVGGITLNMSLSKIKDDTTLEHLPRSLETNREFLKEKIS